jgi:hypothetical protein
MNYIGQREADPLTFVLYPCEGSGIALFYEDAGEGYEHLNEDYARRIQLELRELASEPEFVLSGKTVAARHYDPERRCLLLTLDETSSSQVIELSTKK